MVPENKANAFLEGTKSSNLRVLKGKHTLNWKYSLLCVFIHVSIISEAYFAGI